MHSQLIRGMCVARHRRDERGAIAIILALSMVLFCLVGAMVLDFGLARVDREVDQSSADSATLAGLHALNIGDGSAHPYIGVCNAVRYLKANDDRFSGINDSAGWTNGVGVATAPGCTDAALRNRTCSVTDKSSWAVWRWVGTSGGLSLDVTIQSGYSFTSSTWPEDSLAASTPNSAQQGCDQLAVTVLQNRKPGLGSLATKSNLVTRIRSVGRVKLVPGHSAPALLLLKRTGCPALSSGNAGGGSGTFIHVLGALGNVMNPNGTFTTNGRGTAQPGTIHSDSDGVGCPNNTMVFMGNQNDGIVAYAAPLLSNPSAPDPLKPGSITSVALANGVGTNVVRDSLDWVYGSSAINTAGTKNEVTGRSLVTRGLVDDRYGVGAPTSTGVPLAVSRANSELSAGSSGPASGWTQLNNCNPTQAQVNSAAPNSSTWLYVKCTSGNGFTGDSGGLTIKAGRVFFNGVVNPSGSLSMPNATQVYVANQTNKTDAVNLGTGATFGVNNASSNLTAGTCSNGQSPSKSTLYLRSGDFKETGGSLQLCRTTVFMMGGSTNGCLPSTAGTAPTTNPCPGINGGLGTGQFTQTGGDIDWTAPDVIDVTLDSAGIPLPAAVAGWADPNGPEDLALWSESATNSSSTYNMTGGGVFHVRGIYMVPNASPFKLSGGANMNLTNAQYIVSDIALNGGTQITMSVDPNSAVTLADLGIEGLVR